MEKNAEFPGRLAMNPRAIQIVLTLAQELHFGRAAAKLYMSQPALSAMVKNLELELDAQLFLRSTRQVELTASGRVFLEEARELMAQADRLVARVRRSAQESAGLLRVGYSPCCNVGWICSLLARVNRDEESAVRLSLVSAPSVRLRRMLLKQELQAAFLPEPDDGGELHGEALFREDLVAAVAPGHRLSGKSELSLAELTGEPVILLRAEEEPGLCASLLQRCRQQGFEPHPQQEVPSFQECVAYVREGIGISFLPSSIRLDCREDSIESLGISGDGLHLETFLHYLRDSLPAGLDSLLRLVRRHVNEEAPFHSLHSLVPRFQRVGDSSPL